MTLGSKGSLAFDGKNSFIRQRFQRSLKIRQEPGCFNGALASGLAKGKSLESALCYASAFASLAVETSNASDMPEHESVIHRIQSIHYQQTILRIKKGQRMNNAKSLKCSLLGIGIFI
ncbi:hypothetical protein DMI70_26250 [Escherichia coli]|nr:hypothetical protein [Escherichia coli]